MSRTTARSGPRLLALLAAISLALSTAALIAPAVVLADGDDSPQACTDLTGNVDGGDGDEVTVPAPEGQLVDAICIKSGEAAFDGLKHSGLITADGAYGTNDCYVVEGIGTDEVTVTVDSEAEGCHGISHVDFSTVAAPTPTPTATATATATSTATGQLGGTPTPRGSVLAGVPNTAMDQGASSPTLPALSLSLLLIGSLAGMAYLRLARDRR